MIVGNLVRNFNEGGNFHEYDINMGICMSDHFCGGTGTPETSELDDFYWQKLWRQKIFMRCLTAPACI